jgi:hypothetical protein
LWLAKGVWSIRSYHQRHCSRLPPLIDAADWFRIATIWNGLNFRPFLLIRAWGPGTVVETRNPYPVSSVNEV